MNKVEPQRPSQVHLWLRRGFGGGGARGLTEIRYRGAAHTVLFKLLNALLESVKLVLECIHFPRVITERLNTAQTRGQHSDGIIRKVVHVGGLPYRL